MQIANQWTGFYIMSTVILNQLVKICFATFYFQKYDRLEDSRKIGEYIILELLTL